MSVLIYFYLLILFFGPKYGILDTRMLLLPIGLVLSNGYLANWRTLRLTFSILSFLLVYSLFIFFLNHYVYPDFLRYFRGIISLLAMGLLFNSKQISLEKIINGFFLVLFTHAFLMLIMLFAPTVQPYIFRLLNYEIVVRYLRVTGLTAGFDIAGFITILSTVFAYKYLSRTYKTKYLVFMILSISMTLFTSRGNMIYLSILFLLLLKHFFLKSSLSLRDIILLFLIFIVGIFFMYDLVLPVFSQTLSSNLIGLSKSNNMDFVQKSYAYTDPSKMIRSFITLPDSGVGILFGKSAYPASDSGYIQTINAIGVFGLLVTLGFYLKTYRNILFFYRSSNSRSNYSNISDVFLNASMLLFFLTLIASIKNQYFFTRSVFEMFIFCSFVMEYIYRQSIFKIDTSF